MSIAHFDNGFSTPTIYKLTGKGVIAISKETAALQAKAKEEQITDYQGGVMLVVDFSSQGIEEIQYICNPYQAAVLGIGALITRMILDKHDPKG